MGRWTGAIYKISTNSRLFVITGYRVCETKISSDKSLSSYAQQYTMMLEKGIEKPNPRKQFCLDMIAFIRSLNITDKDYLVLAMDANTGNEKGMGDTQEILDRCNLVDLYTEKHEDYQEFPTHENGSKKIDYLLCTRNLVKHITKVGYLHYEEAFESDHRAVFCDISEDILINTPEPTIERVRMIGTNSTNEEGENYIRHLYNKIDEHKIFEKAELLFNKITTENHSKEDIENWH
jgi:hypothetical protein